MPEHVAKWHELFGPTLYEKQFDLIFLDFKIKLCSAFSASDSIKS